MFFCHCFFVWFCCIMWYIWDICFCLLLGYPDKFWRIWSGDWLWYLDNWWWRWSWRPKDCAPSVSTHCLFLEISGLYEILLIFFSLILPTTTKRRSLVNTLVIIINLHVVHLLVLLQWSLTQILRIHCQKGAHWKWRPRMKLESGWLALFLHAPLPPQSFKIDWKKKYAVDPT